jgi:hypothetical protein
MQIFHRSRIAGTWPNGEPQSVRDAADRNGRVLFSDHAYDVYMVVIGDYDVYNVVAVFADRKEAQLGAYAYNEAYVSADCGIKRYARVEEVSFYPAGVSPQR